MNTDNKEKYQEPQVHITLNVTGMSNRHILFLQLIAEYDLSDKGIQSKILDIINSKWCPPIIDDHIRGMANNWESDK